MSDSPAPREVVIDAPGLALSGRFFAPRGAARAHVILNGATGVPQRFYASFAAWAAAQGVGVLTYDYRDFGASSRGHARDSAATMADWAVHDQMAARRALAALAPEGPLWMIGHSIGGLGVPFHDAEPRLARIITVGSGYAHVGDHPWRYRPLVLAFWYGPGPVATRMAGYLPGRRLGLGSDLPAGVYWQWRRWCTRRDFFHRDVGPHLPPPNFTDGPPVRLIAVADDAMVPPSAVGRYASEFPPDRVTRELLRPARLGVGRLGHLGAFAPAGQAAWPVILGLDAT